jgi:RimJ/RimL family protein N-acetyltransferase
MAAAKPLNPPELIHAPGLRLRRSTPRDAPAMFRAAHDPDVMRYMDWPAQLALGEAWAFLDAADQRWRDDQEYHWMIEPDGATEPVGCMSCRPKGCTVEVSLFLMREAWGRGLGTAALRALVVWLVGRPTVWRIAATLDAQNVPAAAVCEAAGLRREGLMRRATVRPNIGPEPRDSCVYGLGRDDFPADAGTRTQLGN